MQLLKGQYEREKRLLDEKVRQLAELESTQEESKTLILQNSKLKKENDKLQLQVTEEKNRN